jgi:telomere length regulation protein
MWKVREIADKVTNVVMNYTDIEAKVREATNDDSWGPTGTIRHELSTATFSYDQFPEVMGMLWKRIAENKRNPRRIYKSLLLLHHLLLNGSDRVVRATQDRMYELRSLQDYHIVYEPGFNLSSIMPVSEYKDGEVNVRVKAKEIVDLVQDDDKLKEDRKKAKKNRDKYVGIGSDRMMNRWNNGGDYDDDFKSDSYYKSSGDSYKERDRDRDDESNSPPMSSSRKFESSGGAKPWSNTSIRKAESTQDTDFDFNPRAGEYQSHADTEFGSFKASGDPGLTSAVAPSASSVPKGDFADFQSAFSGDNSTSSPTPSAGLNNSFDLLGLDDQRQQTAPVPTMQHLHNQPSVYTLQPPPGSGIQLKNFQQQQQQSTMAQPVTNVQLLQQQALPPQQQQQLFDMTTPIAANNSSTLPPNFSSDLNSVQLQPTFFQPIPNNTLFQQQSFAQTQSQQSGNLLIDQPSFGGDTLLQPISIQSTQANNNMNNNNNTSSSKCSSGGVSLKGTTWSDLNISIDDLNLSKVKPKPTPQPSINQLQLHSPTKSFQN